MTLTDELTALKTKEQNLSSSSAKGKVANFSYTDGAYQEDDYEGVTEYTKGNGQNIPMADASTLKTNQTVLTDGLRAQASSVSRQLMNHFFGRVSYNLNKAHDNIVVLLTKLISYMGTANGIATLDENSKVTDSQLKLGTAEGLATLRSEEARLTASQSPYGTEIPVSETDGRDVTSYMKKLFTLPYLGRNWTKVSGTTDSYKFNTVYYGDGLWVAGSESHGLWWSEDGKDWTQVSGATASYTFNNVYYGNGLWVAGSFGNGLWWSEDGKAWTQVSKNTTVKILDIYYANGIWLTSISYNIGIEVSTIWWSEDGKNWNDSSGLSSARATSFYYANGLWVASCDYMGSGSGGGLWSSTDGKAWSKGSFSTEIGSGKVHYFNNIWLAGYSAGVGILYSEDGNTWTKISVGGDITSLYSANGVCVACSFNKGIFLSTDGKTWIKINTINSYAVHYANGVWVVGSRADGILWSSIDNLEGFPMLD